jgi:hypothetical protein
MLIGAVIRHKIQNELELSFMRRRDQRIEVTKRTEQRIDGCVIRNVIAEVSHRRRIERRNPNRIDTQRNQIVQPSRDAAQIAHAIAVGVLKAARIHLIDDARLPPLLHIRHPTRMLRPAGNGNAKRRVA